MENIIILILFTYPGVMADYLHGMMVRGKQYESKPEEYFRIARDFFLSAIISALTMIPYSLIMGIPYSLRETRRAAANGYGLFIFMGLSLILSATAAGVWTVINKISLKIRNRIRASGGKNIISEKRDVWASVFEDPYIGYNTCAIAVYQDGKLIRAGLPLNVSDDYKKDPWAILTWTETARMELEQPAEARTLLINPVASAVNTENGITVDFYDGTKYRKFISSWVAEVEEHSEQVEAEE